jgi:tetratricopeptide (TPR) repeat protein
MQREKVFAITIFPVILMSLVFSSSGKGFIFADDTNKEKPEVQRERTAVGLLRYADWLVADNPEKALGQYDLLLKKFPHTEEAGKGYFGRGLCLYKLGEYLEAFENIEKSFPKSPVKTEIDKRCALEYKIGRKIMAEKNKVVKEGGGFLKKSETGYQVAARIFKAILYNDPANKIAPEVLFSLGECEFAMGRYKHARQAYMRLVTYHADSSLVPIAKLRAAKCYASKSHGRKNSTRSVENTMKAEELVKSVRKTGASASVDSRELQNTVKLVESKKAAEMLKSAKYYLKIHKKGSRNSSIFILNDIISRYPGTYSAKEAAGLLEKHGEK